MKEIDQKLWKYIPKKYQPAIKKLYRDDDGVWLVLKEGWVGEDGRTYHCDTINQMLCDLRHKTHKIEEA